MDALAFFQPIALQAEAAGAGSNYISPARGDVPDLAHSVHGVVFATQRILDKKPKEVAAFQRAIERAQRDIHEYPGEMKSLLAGYLKGTDPEALRIDSPR